MPKLLKPERKHRTRRNGKCCGCFCYNACFIRVFAKNHGQISSRGVRNTPTQNDHVWAVRRIHNCPSIPLWLREIH